MSLTGSRVEALFKDQQEYVSKVAKNEKDALALVEAGFEYVCDFNYHRIFRKTKNCPSTVVWVWMELYPKPKST